MTSTVNNTVKSPVPNTQPGMGTTPVAFVAFVLLLLLGACGQSDPVVQPAPTDRTNEQADGQEGDEPGELAATEDDSTTQSESGSGLQTESEGPATTLDLSQEEEPDEAPETFSEQLEESEYLEIQATEAEVQLTAQNNCENLVDVMVDQYQHLLDDLGTASRDNTAAVDQAFEGLSLSGALITRRVNEIGCTEGDITDLTCAAVGRLRPQGPVGDDLISIWSENC